MVELAVLAGVALGEDGDGRFVVLQQLDALDNGFQGGAVIFTVDGLAENFVHDLAHDEQLLILLLGDKGQLALWEAVQQHTGSAMNRWLHTSTNRPSVGTFSKPVVWMRTRSRLTNASMYTCVTLR